MPNQNPIRIEPCYRKLLLSLLVILLTTGCTESKKQAFIGNSVSVLYVSSHPPSVDTLKRAKEFRAEIDNAYKGIREKHIYDLDTKIQLTQIALKYIPIGSKMSDAADFLNAAGFEVGDYHKNQSYPRQFMGVLHMEDFLLGNKSIDIRLLPKSDEDFTVYTIEMQTHTTSL